MTHGRRALFALVVTLLLAGCGSSDRPSRYELCLAHGGDYEYDGWSGDFSCDLSPNKPPVNS